MVRKFSIGRFATRRGYVHSHFEDTIFTSPSGDGTACTCSFEQQARAVCKAKAVPLFLLYFKVQSTRPSPRPPALQSSALPTELILPRLNKPKRTLLLTD